MHVYKASQDGLDIPVGADNNTAKELDIFVNGGHVKRVVPGEAFNPPSGWSSFPPHKHDGRDEEPYPEEVYYYHMNPSQRSGYQTLYTKDGSLDGAHTARVGMPW